MLLCSRSVCLRASLTNKQCTAVYQTTKLIINLIDITLKFTVFSFSRELTQLKFLVAVILSCSEIWVQRELSDYPMGKELWLPLITESWHLLLLFVGSLEMFIALTEWLIQTEKFVKNLHANTGLSSCDVGREVGWCIGGSSSKTGRIRFLYTAEI
jgi:hypothetical protein